MTQFPVGLDCIFHLRGMPYSRCTFLYNFLLLDNSTHAIINKQTNKQTKKKKKKKKKKKLLRG
jgi:hypothetical protein